MTAFRLAVSWRNRTLLARFSRRLAQDDQSIDRFYSPTFSKDGKGIDIDRFNFIGEIARQLRQSYERIAYCFQVSRQRRRESLGASARP